MSKSLIRFIESQLESDEAYAWVLLREVEKEERQNAGALSHARIDLAHARGRIAELKILERAIKRGMITTITDEDTSKIDALGKLLTDRRFCFVKDIEDEINAILK